jgi:transcriptional regulator with PAS, ATPase and Fis domain
MILDKELNVLELNPACERLFRIKEEEIVNKSVFTIIDDDILIEVKERRESINLKKVIYKKYNIILLQHLVYVEEEDIILVIMTDITSLEKNKEISSLSKEETLEAAQNVIEKQMRVAQEIAGLLGETTAETKVVLNKLRQLVLKDGD